ncbi:hypothetical protein EHV15_34780 [Paenibacillus oralis]|uniref:DUF4362 domain-containing protein n=1 Tax=Paenibacillus oralis TaxID=2490856 RepID=A0A3P3T9U1_9BACL|nr:hypothetical protein [Paenibacillus oralis]RRJ54760.1 hypothetical protein EHV15_34780 [Paenibacillus oralis]
MKMVFKRVVLLSAVVLMAGGCSKATKSLPGVYEMSNSAYAAYDETVLSGQQVDMALNRYKEFLAIIVVKDGQSYVFGDNKAALKVAGESKTVDLSEKEEVIDRDRTYKSFVLRDSNNEVVGLQLTERKQ